MDSNKIKTNLKGAREAIKQKDFKGAINLCKTVLTTDRSNYNGLVLLGAALQETDQKDQAVKAFKKAISVAPNQILAYQGLSSYYEKIAVKTNDEDKELIKTYKQLLALENDTVKYGDLCTKLAQLSVNALGTEKCVEMMTTCQPDDADKQKIIDKELLQVLLLDKELSPHLEIMLENFLEKYVSDGASSTEEINQYYKRYLKLLYKLKKIPLLVREAHHCSSILPAAEFPLEWLCKVYSEEVTNECSPAISDDNISECYTQLMALNPDSTMAHLARGAQKFLAGDFYEAGQTMKRVTSASQLPYAWVYLCRSQGHMHCFLEAVSSARRAIAAITKHEPDNNRLLKLLSIELAEALSRLSTMEANAEAVTMCDQLLQTYPGQPEVSIILTRALLQGGLSDSRVLELLQDHEINPEYTAVQSARLQAMYLQAKHKLMEAENILRTAVSQHPDDDKLWLMLGEMCVELGRDDLGLHALLKSTKLSPHCSTNYLRLGQLYSRNGRDVDKARRCFIKALQLNPQSAEAGQGLADIYHITGNQEGCLEILKTATRQSGGAKWAWLRLGIIQYGDKDYENAINSLAAAVRADPTDSNCLSALGDAYAARGSYNSALKSYQRVSQLDTQSSYPLLQVAHIKLKLGLLEEAAQQFALIGQSDVGYLPALKGLAETYLRQARSCVERQLLGRAKLYCQKAIDVLARSIELRRDLSCLWKLVGDTLLIASHLQEDVCVTIPPALREDGTETSLKRDAMLVFGARCICRALSLCNEIGNLAWHDLAVNYHTQASIAKDSSEKSRFNERALAAAKKAVQMDACVWQHWNILGVVAASQEPPNYRLAQHAFIRSIQSTRSNPVPWTNLGVIYLCVGSMKLANEAFRQAQRAEPAYVEAWIGQATVAEITNNDDAMDLFRHTTELGVHRESCIGYASWVCSTLVSRETCRDYEYVIEKMHAITVATDCLTWYTALLPKNSCAYNMLGMLLERQGQHSRAASAYESALRHLEDDTKLDAVRTNFARVLVELGRCEEAIRQYQLIKTANFITQCGLALAYFKAEMYEESHSTYESALHWLAPTDGFKSHVLVAMAAMVYMFQGMEEAQTLLYQCITLKPASVQGLFAMCSLGLLHSDINLSQLVLTELDSHNHDPEYITDIAVFHAFTHYIQDQSLEAIHVLCSYTHRHPGSSGLWLALALLLLHDYSTERAGAAGRCAHVAVSLGRGTLDVSKIMFVASLSELLSGKGLASLRSSQKAVHMYPTTAENWAVLIAARQSQSHDTVWLRGVIEHVRTQLKTSKPLGKWLGHNARELAQDA